MAQSAQYHQEIAQLQRAISYIPDLQRQLNPHQADSNASVLGLEKPLDVMAVDQPRTDHDLQSLLGLFVIPKDVATGSPGNRRKRLAMPIERRTPWCMGSLRGSAKRPSRYHSPLIIRCGR